MILFEFRPHPPKNTKYTVDQMYRNKFLILTLETTQRIQSLNIPCQSSCGYAEISMLMLP
jgi:hypothetical protein